MRLFTTKNISRTRKTEITEGIDALQFPEPNRDPWPMDKGPITYNPSDYTEEAQPEPTGSKYEERIEWWEGFFNTLQMITLWQLLGVLPMALVLWVSLGLMLDPALSRDNAIACYIVRHEYFCRKTKEDMAAFMVNIEKRKGGGVIMGYAAMPQGPDPLGKKAETEAMEPAPAPQPVDSSQAH